jgi:NAD(P)-dependent dehydrogenase (short-subunit alcohol dehydrogenase family)
MNTRKLFDLTGRVAMITGGSVGLGRQMAEGLAEMGASLVLCARKKERCEQAAKELQSMGVETLALGGDPASIRSVSAAVIEKNKETFLRKIPLGRFGNEDDLKGAAVFLASDASNYVTGHVLIVMEGKPLRRGEVHNEHSTHASSVPAICGTTVFLSNRSGLRE